MLREDSVTYSSLPQEEGMTPSSNFITPRTSSGHNQRDCKLATILTIVIIIAGIGLAVTIPFIVRGASSEKSTGEKDSLLDNSDAAGVWSSLLDAGEGESAVLNETLQDLGSNTEKDQGDEIEKTTVKEPPATTEKVFEEVTHEQYDPVKPHPVKMTLEPKEPTPTEAEPKDLIPIAPQTPVNESSIPPSDVKVTTEQVVIDGKESPADILESSEEVVDKGSSSEDGADTEWSFTPDKPNLYQPPDNEQSSEVPSVDKGSGNDMDQLLDVLYGEEGHSKPTSVSSDSWMNNIGTTQDKVAIASLAAVVALALASVIAAVAWVVHSRITSHRRRINIQNVITDLQSRDKIVLLNSESEEEE